MRTHPKYPHVPKDTGRLIRSLIRSLVIAIAFFTALTIAIEILKP